MKNILKYLTTTLILGLGVSAPAAVTGQWDFNSGDLSATVGSSLGDFNGTTLAATTFSTTLIGGSPANVMNYPTTTAGASGQGYIMNHGMSPNGGSVLGLVNQWTLIMDIMYPTSSHATWRTLLQANPANTTDATLFVKNSAASGIGNYGQYAGSIQPETWYRVAFVVDLTAPTDRLKKYIDGTLVGTQSAIGGLFFDSSFALQSTALLFADNDGDTRAGSVNSIQINDVALSDAQIAALGGATAAGITAVPEPASGLVLGAGMVLLAARRLRRSS